MTLADEAESMRKIFVGLEELFHITEGLRKEMVRFVETSNSATKTGKETEYISFLLGVLRYLDKEIID